MVLKPKRQLWVPSKPAIIVPNRRPIPVVRPPTIPARRFIPVRGAVALDATGTHKTITSTGIVANSFTGLTISAGLTNSAACFSIVYGTGSPSFSSVTWNSVACTQIGNITGGGSGGVAWFGIVNPGSGNNTFSFTPSVSVEAYVEGCSFQNVLQTGGTSTFANFNSNNSLTAVLTKTLAITTAVGDFTMCAAMLGTPASPAFTAPSGSQIYLDSTDPAGAGVTAAAAQQATASGTSTSYTAANSSSDVLLMAGFDLVAAAATAVVEEDNSHVLRRYWSGWTPNANLLRNTAQDFSSSAVETNPHWRPWTFPPQWARTGRLLQDAALDVPVVVTPDTPPPFQPRTWPVQWVRTWQLLLNTAQDFSSSAVETNVHTVFKTWPVQWLPTKGLQLNTDTLAPVPQPETNVHFIPRTFPPQWAPLKNLQNTAQDFNGPAVETNPHWIGKTWPIQWTPQPLTRAPPNDVPTPTQPETNVHTIFKTWPVQWIMLPALRYNTAQDFSSSAVETNVYFIPRTWPPQWRLQASLLRGTAQDFSNLPPATNPVYARYGAAVGFGSTWAIPGEIPS